MGCGIGPDHALSLDMMNLNASPDPKPYLVSGPLCRGGRRYRTLRLATRAVDRLDAEYGASAHSWRRVTVEGSL